MTSITSALVRSLRDTTDQPLMQCKAALLACDGDPIRAYAWLLNRPTTEQRIDQLERDVRELRSLIAKLRS